MPEKQIDRLAGVRLGVPFEAVIGERFIQRDDGVDRGIVEGIVCSSGSGAYVVYTKDGPLPLIEARDVLNESAYKVALERWAWRNARC